MWEMEKLLVTSNFSFSHNVFKTCLVLMRQNEYLWSKGLKTRACLVKSLAIFSPHGSLNFPSTGQDWRWGDQDGGVGNIGVVCSYDENRKVVEVSGKSRISP